MQKYVCVCMYLYVTDLAKDYVYENFQHLPYRNNKIAAQYERSAPEPSPKVSRTINLSTHICHAAALFFTDFFYIFIILEIPKNVMLCKILFMSFHVKTTLFHRFNKFPLCEERKTTTMAAAKYMPRYSTWVCMCLCVPVCLRIIYGMPLHIASSEPVKESERGESGRRKTWKLKNYAPLINARH